MPTWSLEQQCKNDNPYCSVIRIGKLEKGQGINQGVKLIAYPVFALHHACVSKKGGGVPEVTSIDNGPITIARIPNSIETCQRILHTSSLIHCIHP